jgi:hypothetical protein
MEILKQGKAVAAIAILLVGMFAAAGPAIADTAAGGSQQIASNSGSSSSVSDSVYSDNTGATGSAGITGASIDSSGVSSVSDSVYTGATGSAGITGAGMDSSEVSSVVYSVYAQTLDDSGVTATSATLNGCIMNGGAGINECGFLYSTDQAKWMMAAANNADLTGHFYYSLSGLTASTKYYFKACVVNAGGTTSYGNVCNFESGNPPLSLTAESSNLPDGEVNSPYTSGAISQYVCASGGSGTYSFSVDSGTLPIGLSFNNNEISGTPGDIGMYNVVVTVTDSNNDLPASLALSLQMDFPGGLENKAF